MDYNNMNYNNMNYNNNMNYYNNIEPIKYDNKWNTYPNVWNRQFTEERLDKLVRMVKDGE